MPPRVHFGTRLPSIPLGCAPSGTARFSFGKNWGKRMFSFALPLNLSGLPENWFGKSSVGDVRVGAQSKFLLGFFDFHTEKIAVSRSFNPWLRKGGTQSASQVAAKVQIDERGIRSQMARDAAGFLKQKNVRSAQCPCAARPASLRGHA